MLSVLPTAKNLDESRLLIKGSRNLNGLVLFGCILAQNDGRIVVALILPKQKHSAC